MAMVAAEQEPMVAVFFTIIFIYVMNEYWLPFSHCDGPDSLLEFVSVKSLLHDCRRKIRQTTNHHQWPSARKKMRWRDTVVNNKSNVFISILLRSKKKHVRCVPFSIHQQNDVSSKNKTIFGLVVYRGSLFAKCGWVTNSHIGWNTNIFPLLGLQ